MDEVIQRLERLEKKLDAILSGPEPDVVDAAGALRFTGCRTANAQRVWFHKHKLKPYIRGKYRVGQIKSKVAELQFQRNRKAA
jgi:hypothetical protein